MIVGVADVYVGETRAARLTQTTESTTFTYVADYAGPPVALHLPLDAPTVTTPGTFLHPFFANLLPEGFRLQTLRDRIGVAADDAFSLLLHVGADTIGDVIVVRDGQAPTQREPRFRLEDAAEIDFLQLLEDDVAGSAVPGVQEKLSSQVVSFPVLAGASAAILKLSPPAYPLLVENEAFHLRMAQNAGLVVPQTRVITDITGRSGLLVRRFDREAHEKRHQEDGCQLLNIYPGSKYAPSIRQIAEILKHFVPAYNIELRKLLELLVFSYLIGNGDLHAKNVSVYRGPKGVLELTPAYDLLSTLPYRRLSSNMALKMDGRDANFRRSHFREFFLRHGLPTKAVDRSIDRLLSKTEPWIDRIHEIGYDAETTEHVQRAMRERRRHLSEL